MLCHVDTVEAPSSYRDAHIAHVDKNEFNGFERVLHNHWPPGLSTSSLQCGRFCIRGRRREVLGCGGEESHAACMGGDLGCLGTAPQKLRWGNGPCIRPSNIWRSSVIGSVR